MTIAIKANKKTVRIQLTEEGQNINVELDDNGNALVQMSIVIVGVKAISHDRTYEKPRKDSFVAEPGKYECIVLMNALHEDDTFGANYNAAWKINNELVALAKGRLKKAADTGHERFNLVIEKATGG